MDIDAAMGMGLLLDLRRRLVLARGLLLAVVAFACASPEPRDQSAATRGIVRVEQHDVSAAAPRTALVIGNADYPAAPLRNPVNDAIAVGNALRALGFEVSLVTNARYAEMKRAIFEFGERVKSVGGVALFYFSGHGVGIEAGNYLVPVDAALQSSDQIDVEAVPANMVLNAMDASKAQVNLVFLDACRNNPFARSFRSTESGLNFMDAPRGTLIAYATAPGRVAKDGDGAYGTYTASLLQHIGTPQITVEQVLKRVGRDVEAATDGAQTPWLSSSLRGEFYFVAGSQSSAAKDEAPRVIVSDMVQVPGGRFIAGCDAMKERCSPSHQLPRQELDVPTFEISRTEVTVAQYGACVEAGACSSDKLVSPELDLCDYREHPSDECNWAQPDRQAHPLNCVNWFQAKTYCEWIGGRLPTDHEWEKAARGTDGRTFPWGNTVQLRVPPANFWDRSSNVGWRHNPQHSVFLADYDDHAARTAPVASYPAGVSPVGAFDMAGNVWEWTLSGASRGGDWGSGGLWSQRTSPNWDGHMPQAESSYSQRFEPWRRTPFGGFRCVKSGAPATPPALDMPRAPAPLTGEALEARRAAVERWKQQPQSKDSAVRYTGGDFGALKLAAAPGVTQVDWIRSLLASKPGSVERCTKGLAAGPDTYLLSFEFGVDEAGALRSVDAKCRTTDARKWKTRWIPWDDCNPTVVSQLAECLRLGYGDLSFGPVCRPGSFVVKYEINGSVMSGPSCNSPAGCP